MQVQKWLFVLCCIVAGYHALNAWPSRCPFNERIVLASDRRSDIK